MTDKIKSEDFIKAFGSDVSAKVENTHMKLEVNSPIVIDCKYYLPCGRCDKTNGLCQMLDEIVMPVKPDETVQRKLEGCRKGGKCEDCADKYVCEFSALRER